MKWLIVTLLVGYIEYYFVSSLHLFFGLEHLIKILVTSTALGAIFLLLNYGKFKSARESMQNLDESLVEKSMDLKQKLSPDEIKMLRPRMFTALFYIAFILIAIPGLISDLIGAILMSPYLSDKIVDSQIKKTIKHFHSNPNGTG